MVAEAHIDPAVFPQPVRRLVSADAEPGEIHKDLHPVKIVGGFHRQQLILQHMDPGKGVDVRTEPAGECQGVSEQLAAVLDHLAAPSVDCRIQDRVRAGGHQKIRTGGQVCRVHQVTLQVVDRTLFEAGAHFVHTDHADVCAGIHGPGGQVFMVGKRAPQASSTINGFPRSWQIFAIAAMSAHVP